MLLLFWLHSDFLPQLFFALLCFKGRCCQFSSYYQYCSKLNPEP